MAGMFLKGPLDGDWNFIGQLSREIKEWKFKNAIETTLSREDVVFLFCKIVNQSQNSIQSMRLCHGNKHLGLHLNLVQ